MAKRTQTIRRQQPTISVNVFYQFVGLALKALISITQTYLGFCLTPNFFVKLVVKNRHCLFGCVDMNVNYEEVKDEFCP